MGILKIENMTMQFGGLKAVDNFSLELGNEIVAVIGPNGAGKTTVFNVVTGVYQPTQGKVFFEGRDMAGRKPFEFANAGIARTFQNIRLFGNATVLDNLLIAQTNSCGYGLCASLLRTRKFREQEQRMVDRAMELLEVFHLDQFAESLAKNLPYGPQRKLEIARALMTGPKVLLLACRGSGKPAPEAAALGVAMTDLPALLRESDVVSLHLPGTEQNAGLFGEATFAAMKPGSVLINTARGILVDSRALLAAVRSGKLAGAAVDVYRPEPPGPEEPLLQDPRILCTPHSASETKEAYARCGDTIAGQILDVFSGRTPENWMNPW